MVADTEPAFAADGVTIADQSYLDRHRRLTPLTLPAVTDGSGNAPITYTLTPALPDGLTFNPTSPPTITGTPTAAAAVADYTYTATDADDDTAPLTFSITVEADTEPGLRRADPDGVMTIAAQNYLTGTTVDLTLPAVTDGSGNAPITYTLAPALPDGLTFNPTSPPTITGTPTAAAAVADYTYTATDANDDTAPLTFSITVNAPATGFTLEVVDQDSGLAVSEVLEGTTRDLRVTATPTPAGSAFAADQMVTFTVTPPPLASPPANAADPYVVYTAVAPGTMPLAVGAASAGFEFTLATTNDNVDHADFPLTMTATAESSGISGTAAVTLLDNDIRITTTTASATVVAGATATYEVTLSEAPPDTITVTVASQDAGTATVSPATLPFTVGNWNTAQTVTVTGVAMGTTTIRHSAPDNSGFTFIPNDVAVTVTVADTAPAFAAGEAIEDQNYIDGQMITPLTLPAVETPGNGATTYTLTPALPAGLTFNGATTPPTITGTPTAAVLVTEYTYTAGDTDESAVGTDEVSLPFSITVVADTAPAFADGETIAPANYIEGVAITPLTLPQATGGNGDIMYALSPPDGLTFNPTTRVLSGAPTTAAPAVDFTYTATDEDDDTVMLTISITVRTQATGFTLSVLGTPGNAPVSTVLEGAEPTLDVTATPTPAGSAFAADQMVTFTVTPPLSSPPASASDPYVAYAAIAPGTIPLAVGAANAPFAFTIATIDDALDHADYPVTITATASPSGSTGTATVTLLDNDIRITTTTASATVVAGATATYEVTLSEAPPAATTVTVASQGTATATVSRATLTFTTGNWNTAQTVTVTGVAMGSTTISHTAPDNAGYAFVTNNVAVTVTAPAVAAPVFTNAAAFTSPIDVEENQTAVRDADYFGASDTSTGNLVLSGADMSFFTLSPTGTLTFNDPPNFEMPRGMAFNAGSNTNNYALTVAATNSTATTTANVTVRVTDENDLPVLAAFTLPTFTEYSAGTYTFTATDEDRPAQTLSFSLAGATHDAAITAAGMFTWTPREADGDVARTFTVRVTDGIGTPPVNVDTEVTITAVERPNQAPTDAAITIADGATSVTNPATLGLTAAATDPDTGDMLTYTWSAAAERRQLRPRDRRHHHLDAADCHGRHHGHPDGHRERRRRHHAADHHGHAECNGESDARRPGLHQRG